MVSTPLAKPGKGEAFDGRTYSPDRDYARLTGQLLAVFELMKDGKFRTLSDISGQIAGSEASLSARLRDLRKDKYGAHDVKRERIEGGLFKYRFGDGMSVETFLNGKVVLHCGDARAVVKTACGQFRGLIGRRSSLCAVSIVKRFGAKDAAACKVPEGGSGAYSRASSALWARLGYRRDRFDPAFWAECLRVLNPEDILSCRRVLVHITSRVRGRRCRF